MKNFLLILIAIFSLAGCGGSEPAKEHVVQTNIETATEAIDLATLPDVIDAKMAAAIQNMDDVLLIDVREQWEYDAAHIPGITLIPMSEFESRVSEIPTDKTVVFACQSGVRSSQVHAYLTQLGYENVHDMAGGILAWQAAGLTVE